MFLSLCPVTAGGGLPWVEFVALAARTGYEGVEVDIGALRAIAARDGEAAARDVFTRHKLRPACCGLPVEFRQDDAKFRDDVKSLAPAAKLARQIGCPRFATWVLPIYPAPKAEMRKTLKARFTEIANVLAAEGCRFGLEFISPWHFRKDNPDNAFCWQFDSMLELAVECGPNVGLLLDSWHWHHDEAHTVEQIVAAGKDRIVHVHLNDSPGLPREKIRDNERLLPGEGVIDLKGFLAALRTIRYADAVSIEVFGRLDGVPADDAARQALATAKKVMSA